MLKEIYMRDPDDEYYSPNILEHSNELENLLGQIRMILFTKQGDVMGSFTFGFNLEDKLFLFNLSGNEIKTKLMEQIYAYCPDAPKFKLDIDVQFVKGTVRDIALIDIIVDDEKRIGILIK
jgi:hypothetical protein